jgi:hypothetical protein
MRQLYGNPMKNVTGFPIHTGAPPPVYIWQDEVPFLRLAGFVFSPYAEPLRCVVHIEMRGVRKVNAHIHRERHTQTPTITIHSTFGRVNVTILFNILYDP